MPERKTRRKSISVQIKLAGDGYASADEFDLRGKLEDELIDRNIGEWEGAGSGLGVMDFSFSVASKKAVEPAIAALRQLLKEYHVADELVKISVNDVYEITCDDLPAFQPGDCLSYQFEDGEYGAAIVLKQVDKPNTRETLVGVLDYKQTVPPSLDVFEQRQWFMRTRHERQPKPYVAWLDCYGGVAIQHIGTIKLTANDPRQSIYQMRWEGLGVDLLIEKNRKLDGT